MSYPFWKKYSLLWKSTNMQNPLVFIPLLLHGCFCDQLDKYFLIHLYIFIGVVELWNSLHAAIVSYKVQILDLQQYLQSQAMINPSWIEWQNANPARVKEKSEGKLEPQSICYMIQLMRKIMNRNHAKIKKY